MKILLAILLLIGFSIGFADTIIPNTSVCSLSAANGAQFLDNIMQQYYNLTSKWQSTILPVATEIFWTFFFFEFLYQLVFKKILAFDVQKIAIFFIVRVFTAYLYAQIFLDPGFYLGIVEFFLNLGAKASGFAINIVSDNPFSSFSPSSILNVANCLWNQVFAEIGNMNLAQSIIYGLPFVAIVVGVYILAAIMAVGLLISAIQSYIVLFAGFVLCGFAGSSWTQNYWQRYLSYVGGVAIRLFVTCLMLGIVEQNTNYLFSKMIGMGTTDWIGFLSNLLLVFVSMLINTILVLKIPATAGSVLSGTINSGLGDLFTAGAVMMGAGMGMAGASVGVASGVKAVGGKVTETAGKLFGSSDNGDGIKTPFVQTAKASSDGSSWGEALKKANTGQSDKKASEYIKGSIKHIGSASSDHGGAAGLNVNAHKE
jgi:P-type conjugative transfer protein TrbL